MSNFLLPYVDSAFVTRFKTNRITSHVAAKVSRGFNFHVATISVISTVTESIYALKKLLHSQWNTTLKGQSLTSEE